MGYNGTKQDIHSVPPEVFYARVSNIRSTNPRMALNLELHTIDHYRGCTCYLSSDGMSGYAITIGDGELQNLFSLVKGRGDLLVQDAVERGARLLNCYDGYLVQLYSRHGFHEYIRLANWTPGEPDVVFMSIDREEGYANYQWFTQQTTEPS